MKTCPDLAFEALVAGVPQQHFKTITCLKNVAHSIAELVFTLL